MPGSGKTIWKVNGRKMLCEPAYIRNFQCTASACQDTCCAGWEIVLDEEALDRYRMVQGDFGKQLKKEIRTEDGESYFALTADKRCPFLDGQGLCDIYKNLGEEALCDICTEHPRFYNWVGDYTEKGLGLCCEEAERLLFKEKEPLRFHCTEPEEGEEISEDLRVLLQLRDEAFAILQDRTMPLKERMTVFKGFMHKVQCALDGEDEEAENTETEEAAFPSVERIRQILDVYHTLDFLDLRWKKLLKQAGTDAAEITRRGEALLAAKKARAYEWEHVAVYLLYRYMIEAVYDGDVELRAGLVCHCLTLLAVLATELELLGGYGEKERDDLLRMFSREIEYCPENMEAVCEAIREGQL